MRPVVRDRKDVQPHLHNDPVPVYRIIKSKYNNGAIVPNIADFSLPELAH